MKQKNKGKKKKSIIKTKKCKQWTEKNRNYKKRLK